MRNYIKFGSVILLILVTSACTKEEPGWSTENLGISNTITSQSISEPSNERICFSPSRVVIPSLAAGVPLDLSFIARNRSEASQCLFSYQQLILVKDCTYLPTPELTNLEPLPRNFCLETNQSISFTVRLNSAQAFSPPEGCDFYYIMRFWLLDSETDPTYWEYHDVVLVFGETSSITIQTIVEPIQLLTFLHQKLTAGEITTSNGGLLRAFENQIGACQSLFERGFYDEMQDKLDWILARCDGSRIPPDMIEGTAAAEFQELVQELSKVLSCR